MVGVAQLNLTFEILQIKGADRAFDGPLCTDVHEDGRLYRPAVGTGKLSPPGAALLFDDLEHRLLLYFV